MAGYKLSMDGGKFSQLNKNTLKCGKTFSLSLIIGFIYYRDNKMGI